MASKTSKLKQFMKNLAGSRKGNNEGSISKEKDTRWCFKVEEVNGGRSNLEVSHEKIEVSHEEARNEGHADDHPPEGTTEGLTSLTGRQKQLFQLSLKMAPKTSADKVERMVKELKDRDEKRISFSRRRKFHEDKDIDSINDRNEPFNEKIERAFGKYTLEMKDNLERGTALPD